MSHRSSGLLSLISLPLLLYTPIADACSCASSDPFLITAARSQLIVRGKVLEYQWDVTDRQHQRPKAMVVEVQEVLKGANRSKHVTIFGDNGLICRRYVSEFPRGTEWVLAVSPDRWSKTSELAISSCGEYALFVQGNRVKGKISPTAQVSETITLANLRNLLKSHLKASASKVR